MRAGLFLEGLARSHEVNVLAVPVFGQPAPPDDFVRRYAASFVVAELPGGVMGAAERLATEPLRRHARALADAPFFARRAGAAAPAVARAARGCDAVHVMREWLAPSLDEVLDDPGGRRLSLDIDDFESRKHRESGDDEVADAYERLEERYLPRFDVVMAASPLDAETLGGQHVGNAVRLPEGPVTPAESHDLLFVGNLSYGPNVEGATWLCTEVVPRLGASVALVGQHPAKEVLGLTATIAADVPEVAPYYAAARVAVAPMLHGGGTPTKVVEGLAHGLPVVATPRAAEGLPPEAGVTVADGTDEFVDACRARLDDPGDAAERGPRWVRQNATVEVVALRIDTILAACRPQPHGEPTTSRSTR